MKNQQKPGKKQEPQQQEKKPITPKGKNANTTLSKPEQEPPAKPEERTEGIP